MASERDAVLSYHDTLLRQSDLCLLRGHEWINDNIIAFWFEYLEYDLYKDVSEAISLISPQVAQMIKSAAHNPDLKEDVCSMLQSMDLNRKQLILMAINDHATDTRKSGGRHWSLLAFNSHTGSFEHYDSFSCSANRVHAEQIVSVLKPIVTSAGHHEIDSNVKQMDCTQQKNGDDCGIHVIANADAICGKIFRNKTEPISEIASETVIDGTRQRVLDVIKSFQST